MVKDESEGGNYVIGQYSFIEKGKLYTISYKAGVGGFQPYMTVKDI